MIGPVVHILLALIVAGIVHLSTVLIMPWVAARDGFVRISALAQDNSMSVLSASEVRNNLPFSDPAKAVATCRYILDKGPVRVRLAAGPWPTAILFLRKGTGIYQSLSDKSAVQGVLDIVIATAEQMKKITALDTDDEPVQEIRIVAPEELGVVVVRSLVRTASEREDVLRQLRAATCETETL